MDFLWSWAWQAPSITPLLRDKGHVATSFTASFCLGQLPQFGAQSVQNSWHRRKRQKEEEARRSIDLPECLPEQKEDECPILQRCLAVVGCNNSCISGTQATEHWAAPCFVLAVNGCNHWPMAVFCKVAIQGPRNVPKSPTQHQGVMSP